MSHKYEEAHKKEATRNCSGRSDEKKKSTCMGTIFITKQRTKLFTHFTTELVQHWPPESS